MVKDLNEAIVKSQEGVSPSELSEVRLWLAAEYARLDNELIGILMRKPETWDKIRYSGEVKSDTSAERKWQQTKDGLRETFLRHQLKDIDKISSAINSRMRILEGEARNSF